MNRSAIVCALVAAVTLTPFCARGAALAVRAKAASIHTEGGLRGDQWNLWSNGHVGEYVRLPAAGDYRIVVRAAGSPAGGVWPEMALAVNGRAVDKVTVKAAEPADYTFRRKLPAGPVELTVSFTNDAVVDREDRNLYLDSIVIHSPPGAAAATVAPAQEIAAMAARQEAKIVAALDAEIDKARKSDATVRVVGADGKPVAGAQVRVEQTRHSFLFGCNIYRFDRFQKPAENEAYKKRFAELFNAATVGFYWRSYEPRRGRPNYEYTDQVVAWCRARGVRMKGHPLLWGHQAGVPTWSKGQPPADVQRKRVTDIIQRYAGKVHFWEVVNEPSHVRSVKIDPPYRWAREADPNAYLIVNDYYVMANGYPPFFALLTKAAADGVPFDGVGIQAHEPRTMRFPLERVRKILDQYAALGKELHITEFTPSSGGQRITGSHLKGVWDEKAQADYAVKFYKACFAHPAVMAVTWWDLCDNGSWLKGGGMLRADLSPKPVYTQLKKLIHTDWKTRTASKTDAAGKLAFRGFHGSYTITVDTPSGPIEAKRRLAKAGPNQWVVKLGT
jgi:endo-1,4-beta-xylanase